MGLLRPLRRTHGDASSPVADAGEERFTFFWRGPLSNWHLRSFVVDDVTYCCVEQFMMAEKARLFGDRIHERAIMASTEPAGHKALGRRVRGFDATAWNREAKGIVLRGSVAKFSQNDDLLDVICATEGTTLVEASPYDTIWGIGLREADPRARNRATWAGLNRLGEVLTEARDDHLLPLQRSRPRR